MAGFDRGVDAAGRMYDRSALPQPRDPKAYLAALGEALAGFPVAIVEECCDPLKGVTRRLRFRPEVSHVLDFCEDRLELYRGITADRHVAVVAVVPARPPRSQEELAHVRQAAGALLEQLRKPKEGEAK